MWLLGGGVKRRHLGFGTRCVNEAEVDKCGVLPCVGLRHTLGADRTWLRAPRACSSSSSTLQLGLVLVLLLSSHTVTQPGCVRDVSVALVMLCVYACLRLAGVSQCIKARCGVCGLCQPATCPDTWHVT